MCILRTALCSSFTDKYRFEIHSHSRQRKGKRKKSKGGKKHVDGEIKIAREFYNERWRDAGGLGDTG